MLRSTFNFSNWLVIMVLGWLWIVERGREGAEETEWLRNDKGIREGGDSVYKEGIPPDQED